MLLLVLAVPQSGFANGKCDGEPTSYKNCELKAYSVDETEAYAKVEMDLRACKNGLELNLQDHIEIVNTKLSAADQIANARIWRATIRDINRKLKAAKSDQLKVTVSVSKTEANGCNPKLFQTAESVTVGE